MTESLTKEDLTSQIRCVTHEIRNHLSICDMYSQILKRNLEKSGAMTPEFENAIECIRQSVKIIGVNLLDLKSLNSETKQIQDFEKLIIRALEMAKAYTTEGKDIKFEVFVKNSANIFVDENKFLSCLINIIKNGIEAINIKGKIDIIAEVKNDFGIIKISNDGKPIPKEKQKNIFEMGYTDKKSGNGLGLGICKRYIESCGGKIELTKSQKGQTTFQINMPVE